MVEEEIKESPFTDPRTFSLYIEKIVHEENLSYIEAIVEYCRLNFIDPEDIPSLLSESLKEKIKNNFITLKYLKPIASFNL